MFEIVLNHMLTVSYPYAHLSFLPNPFRKPPNLSHSPAPSQLVTAVKRLLLHFSYFLQLQLIAVALLVAELLLLLPPLKRFKSFSIFIIKQPQSFRQWFHSSRHFIHFFSFLVFAAPFRCKISRFYRLCFWLSCTLFPMNSSERRFMLVGVATCPREMAFLCFRWTFDATKNDGKWNGNIYKFRLNILRSFVRLSLHCVRGNLMMVFWKWAQASCHHGIQRMQQ